MKIRGKKNKDRLNRRKRRRKICAKTPQALYTLQLCNALILRETTLWRKKGNQVKLISIPTNRFLPPANRLARMREEEGQNGDGARDEEKRTEGKEEDGR